MKIYHTETKEDYDALMVELEAEGATWSFGKKLSEIDNWHIKEHLTCIRVYDSKVNHASLHYYEGEYPQTPIIKYKAREEEMMIYQTGMQNKVVVEKPVIPKFVAVWIEETKKQGKSLVFAITHIYYKNEIGKSPNKEEKKIFQWMELAYNEEVFARAWIDGYEVEKEKLYHVVNKENYFMLRKYDGLVDILYVSPSMSRDEYGKDTRFMLTEQEIKDYDERFWAFAQEVVE